MRAIELKAHALVLNARRDNVARKSGLKERKRIRHRWRVQIADELMAVLVDEMTKLDLLTLDDKTEMLVFAPTKATLATLLVMRTVGRRINFDAVEREVQRRLGEVWDNRARQYRREVSTAIKQALPKKG